MTAKVTLMQRMEYDGIRMQATHLGEKVGDQSGFMPEWPHDLWRCTFSIPGSSRRPLTIEFRRGIGHDGKRPPKDEVLDCLLADASGVADGESFEEWCSNYGFDTDSRLAEKTYVACLKQTERLRTFLGGKFDSYLYDTERL